MKQKLILGMTSILCFISMVLLAENGSYTFDVNSFSSRNNQDQYNIRLISGDLPEAKKFTKPGSPGENLVERLFEIKKRGQKVSWTTIVRVAKEFGMDPTEGIPAAIKRLAAKVDALASSVATLARNLDAHLNSQ